MQSARSNGKSRCKGSDNGGGEAVCSAVSETIGPTLWEPVRALRCCVCVHVLVHACALKCRPVVWPGMSRSVGTNKACLTESYQATIPDSMQQGALWRVKLDGDSYLVGVSSTRISFT